MALVNLRDLYPFCKGDCMIEIPDNDLDRIRKYEREEKAYQRKTRFHNANHTLDGNNPLIESQIVDKPLSPQEVYDRKLTIIYLHRAIANLPDKQAKRIYAHFFLGMSFSKIADAEGVHISTITESVNRGLRNLRKYLTNLF